MSERFLSLPGEKRNIIIDSALTAFSQNGYKKASAGDIASAAGISKAMIFYYFGSKADMYLYLVEYCLNIVIGEIENQDDASVTDFFDRIKLISDIKMSAMKKHPRMPSFLSSVYFETDPEVESCIKNLLAGTEGTRERLTVGRADISKFKEGIDPKLVVKFLTWASEGYASRLKYSENLTDDLGEFVKDFNDCLDMMRKHFYKCE